MTDSPAEKKTEAAGASPANPTIPKQRFDEVNSQKKELAEKLEAMQRELEQLRQGQQPIDMKGLTDTLAEVALKAAEAQVAPFKREAERYKLAVRLGLQREDQLEAVSSYMEKGLDADEALTLARSKNRDLFPVEARPYDPRLAGAMPPGGLSAARAPISTEVDHVKLMQEAAAKRDRAGAKAHAVAEFERRVGRLRG